MLKIQEKLAINIKNLNYRLNFLQVIKPYFAVMKILFILMIFRVRVLLGPALQVRKRR